jgi:hypothetical protein
MQELMAGQFHDLPAPEKFSRERLRLANGPQMKIKMLQFLDAAPAVGTHAAVNWRDYGRARWQL